MLEKKSVVSLKCSDIVSDQNVKLVGHIQNLVGQCPMTDCYFQLWNIVKEGKPRFLFWLLNSNEQATVAHVGKHPNWGILKVFEADIFVSWDGMILNLEIWNTSVGYHYYMA